MRDARVLRRKRINKIMDKLFDYPITIVSATMGYGKTTLVKTYFEGKKIDTVWVSLLGSDGALNIFWNKLTSAMGKIIPSAAEAMENLGFPKDAEQIEVFVNIILRLDYLKPIVVVIDDYHTIDSNKQVGKLIELMAYEEIPDFHIVLVSRTRPILNHIDLLSKGLCYYITAEQIAFTQLEVIEYFSMMKYSPSIEDIKKIYTYTNGWISGIYLFLLGLKQGIAVTEMSNINKLIEQNLFSTFNQQTQQILLKLFIFESFSIAQAAEVLDYPELHQCIDELMQRNAFIEYHYQEDVYKLHSVFLDFLKQKFEMSGIDAMPIYYRAGQWFIRHGNIVSAFECYHRAGKIEELLEYFNKPNMGNINYLSYKQIKKIVDDFSEDFCIKYPFPMLQIALVSIIVGEPTGLVQAKIIVDKMLRHYENVKQDPYRNKILGELKIMGIFLAYNDANRMIELSEEAYELLEGGLSSTVFRHSEFTFGIPHFLFQYYREVGQLKQTLEVLQKGFPPLIFDGCGVGCEYVAVAEYALETGDFDQVEMSAQKAIYKAMPNYQISIIICAKFALMRLAVLQGEHDKITQLMEQTKQMLYEMTNDVKHQNSSISYDIYHMTIDLCEGYVYGCLERPEKIPEWLKEGFLQLQDLPIHIKTYGCVVYGKVVLLKQNWLQLEILCDSFRHYFSVFNNQLGFLMTWIYESIAKYKLYGMASGVAVLVTALNEAAKDNVLLPFAENSEFILPMLYDLRGTNKVDDNYLNRLIQISEQYSISINSLKVPVYELTKREIDILNDVASGLTQNQIAEKEYMSVSGVKKHLENIYRKFGVNNKISALEKARQEKIL